MMLRTMMLRMGNQLQATRFAQQPRQASQRQAGGGELVCVFCVCVCLCVYSCTDDGDMAVRRNAIAEPEAPRLDVELDLIVVLHWLQLISPE